MGQSAINEVNITGKVVAATKEQLSLICMCTPYFIQRKEAALKYLNGDYDELGKQHLLQHIEFCNDSIKLILGL